MNVRNSSHLCEVKIARKRVVRRQPEYERVLYTYARWPPGLTKKKKNTIFVSSSKCHRLVRTKTKHKIKIIQKTGSTQTSNISSISLKLKTNSKTNGHGKHKMWSSFFFFYPTRDPHSIFLLSRRLRLDQPRKTNRKNTKSSLRFNSKKEKKNKFK